MDAVTKRVVAKLIQIRQRNGAGSLERDLNKQLPAIEAFLRGNVSRVRVTKDSLYLTFPWNIISIPDGFKTYIPVHQHYHYRDNDEDLVVIPKGDYNLGAVTVRIHSPKTCSLSYDCYGVSFNRKLPHAPTTNNCYDMCWGGFAAPTKKLNDGDLFGYLLTLKQYCSTTASDGHGYNWSCFLQKYFRYTRTGGLKRGKR